MRVVHRFSLDEQQSVSAPRSARVIHVAMKGGQLNIWIELDTEEEKVDRRFRVIPTGVEVPLGFVHVGTAIQDPWVWHVYEDQS